MATSLQIFAKFNQLSREIVELSGPGGVMAEIENYFDVGARLIISKQIHRAVTLRMRPQVRQLLYAAWRRSGLNAESEKGDGKLYDAATGSALIDADEKGIRIAMSANWSADVYKRAGAFLYGAVYGPREKREVRDPITGKLNVAKSAVATSVLGQSAKRSIKKAALTGTALSKRAKNSLERGVHTRNLSRRRVSLGEVHVRAPRNFWLFTPEEIKALQEAYIRFVVEETGKILKQHRAMKGAA